MRSFGWSIFGISVAVFARIAMARKCLAVTRT